MFFARVIGIDFQHHFDALLVKGLDELLEILEIADFSVDGLEVGDVPSEIVLTIILEDGR